jgi:hypothetical protein
MRGNAFGGSGEDGLYVPQPWDGRGCGDHGDNDGNGFGGGPLSLPWGGGESPCDRGPLNGDGPWALPGWRG